MASQTFLAVDLGAESGRVIAGNFEGTRLTLDELHRFPNRPVRMPGRAGSPGSLRWNPAALWSEIQTGLTAAASRNAVSVGVDTWAVDYVLLSRSGDLLGLPYHYRDRRTRGLIEEATRRISRASIFAESGLQFLEINTLYQLIAHQQHDARLLQTAESLLLMPDFFHWCLSGHRGSEFTNATTTQLLQPTQQRWSEKLIQEFRLPRHLFPEIIAPGTDLGPLRPELAELTGLHNIRVVAPATHDTASAVAAVPVEHSGQPDWCYISSGTWSLIGVEVQAAVLTPQALLYNVTNEGGVDGTYRLLKNVMGLWLVQQLRESFIRQGQHFSYADLARLAAESTPFGPVVDPDAPQFLSPADMAEAIRTFCRETGQNVPATAGELVRCALESLALKYRAVLQQLEELTGVAIRVIHVVGGGCQNTLLNQLTANCCGQPVVAGPVEATAMGNVLIQARSANAIGTLSEIRQVVRASSQLETFEPAETGRWNDAADRFQKICQAHR